MTAPTRPDPTHIAELVRRPEDQVFTLAHVAAKAGEPIVLGEHDEILSAEFDAPYFYLVVRVPWDDAAAWGHTDAD